MGVSAWNAKVEPFFRALRAQASFPCPCAVRDIVLAFVDLAGALEHERDHLIRGARGVGDAVENRKQTFLATERSLEVGALLHLVGGAHDPPSDAARARRHRHAGDRDHNPRCHQALDVLARCKRA